MTQIKKLKNSQGTEFYPRTHTKAVVDDNGYTVESRLQAMQDEINQAQLEAGAVPSDLTPTESSTNWVTSGGLYNELNVGDSNVEIDLTQYEAVRAFIGNTWVVTDNNYPYYGKFIPITPGKYRIIANGSNSAFCGFLKNNTYSQNANIDYATGCTKERIYPGEQAILIAPEDAKYLYVATYTTVDITPEKVERYNKKTVVEVLEFIGNSNTEVVDMDNITEMYGFLDVTNSWKIETNNPAKFSIIDVSSHIGGEVILSTSVRSVIAFLLDSSHSNGTSALYATGGGRKYAENLDKYSISIPTDAKFMYVSTVSTQGVNIKPTYIALTGGFSKCVQLLEYEQNIRNRALQLANLRWTALNNIAGTYILAGNITGLLYSSCVEVDRYVTLDVSVKTFMTSANNPYSLLYTENLKTNTSQYGFTYYNNMATVHAWMGIVCSRFVSFCLGYDDWDTIHFAWLCKQGVLKKSKSQASKDVEIGDVIWVPGHTRIIYDVIKQEGQTKHIIVSEAKQPLVVSTLYTPQTLDDYMSSEHGIFYKYAGSRDTVYEPSEFVNNYNEPLPDDYVYNDDICTYAGDYAAFRVGYPVWINYNLKNVGSWNKIQLYKENWSSANVMTLSLIGEYTIDTSIHKFQIPAADIAGYGKYRARMSDGTNNSDYTFFEVIDTTVSYTTPDENNPNIKKVTFSSANAGYVKVVFCNRAGTPMAVRPLTLQDKINCEITINPVETCLAQRGEILDTDNVYLKVYFRGDYGRVTNDYLKVNF